MVRIYASGVFDLFHYGHGKALEQIKDTFPNSIIVVGIATDEVATQIKRKPILSLEERMKSVEYNKYVNEVIIDPWSPSMSNEELLKWLIENNFDFFAHEDVNGKYELFKQAGRFFKLEYTKSISTTDIINRINNETIAQSNS